MVFNLPADGVNVTRVTPSPFAVGSHDSCVYEPKANVSVVGHVDDDDDEEEVAACACVFRRMRRNCMSIIIRMAGVPRGSGRRSFVETMVRAWLAELGLTGTEKYRRARADEGRDRARRRTV